MVLCKTQLSSRHRAILDVVIHDTYGWYDPDRPERDKAKKRKIFALIPYSRFEELTGIEISNISKLIHDLISWNMLLRMGTRPYEYAFNVDVGQWESSRFRKKFQNWGNSRLSDSTSYQNQQVKVVKSDKLKLLDLTTKPAHNSSDNNVLHESKKRKKEKNNNRDSLSRKSLDDLDSFYSPGKRWKDECLIRLQEIIVPDELGNLESSLVKWAENYTPQLVEKTMRELYAKLDKQVRLAYVAKVLDANCEKSHQNFEFEEAEKHPEDLTRILNLN